MMKKFQMNGPKCEFSTRLIRHEQFSYQEKTEMSMLELHIDVPF